jgi:hypothetical protein
MTFYTQNKEIIIFAGVLLGSFIVANHFMKPKSTKIQENMSNADGRRGARKDGGCRCGRGVVGYCPRSEDCATCCANHS